jgi:hypothetical protein
MQHPDPHSDPSVRGMDPRIRIYTKMSWIQNNGIYLLSVSGSVTFWYVSGSLDPTLDLRIRIRILHFSSVTSRMPTKKKYFFLIYFPYYCQKIPYVLHQSSKIKVIKKSLNDRNQCFIIFLLVDGRIWIWIRIRTILLRIRNQEAQKHPDPEHCFHWTLFF